MKLLAHIINFKRAVNVKRMRWCGGKEKSGCNICVTLTEVHIINKI